MSVKGRLHGRTALITGSSSGLGREVCLAFAAEGANICCVDLYDAPRNAINPTTGKADDVHNRLPDSRSTLLSLVDRNGNSRQDGKDGLRFVFTAADTTKADDMQRAVQTCVETFGRLDIVVNCAGVSVESTHTRVLRAHETSEEDFDLTMRVNTKGVFLSCKHALAQMLQQEPVDWFALGLHKKEKWDRGWIINVASVQGFVAYLGTPSYCASKGAVVMLTRQIALDYAGDRIHCNALCPGFLKTAMTQNLQSQPEVLRGINEAHPLGGMGEPEDVARAAVFLASRDAAWITGVPLAVDGGYTVQ